MFANSSEFFDGSQPQSVIVRQQQQAPEEEFSGHQFPVSSSACFPNTPTTPGYAAHYPPAMQFPFFFPECFQNFNFCHNVDYSPSKQFSLEMDYNNHPSCSYHHHRQRMFPQPQDPNCSNQLGSNLQSPIIGNNALGGSLNPLNNRFVGVGRSSLPYDFPGSSANFMGGQKPRKGGRRPGEEMDDITDDMDPDEVEKKLKRRQRNKEAAARCRQRRLDLMQTLQEQVSREREQNAIKEKEILTVRSALEKMIEFLKGHLGHLPEADRQKFNEIVGSLYKDQHSNGVQQFKIEPVDTSPQMSDYQPQGTAPPSQRIAPKRPAPTLPPTSDMSILEPDMKVPKLPKIEMNQTLTQVNGGMETAEVSRPTTLDITGLQRGGPAAIISTPSNFSQLGYNTFRSTESNFTSLFGGNCDGNVFLNQSTGLTPSGAPNVGFVAQTPTPLQTSEADLRSL